LIEDRQGEIMPNKSVKNSFWIAIAFFCATHTSYAQGDGPTAQNPFAGTALLNIEPNTDGNLTLGGEYKQPKNVVEQEKPVFWTWYTDVGYESEYIFRGTNLMPNSDGGGFFNARVSKWGFTLGLFGIHQLGTASVPSWSIGEGGGSAAAPGNADSTTRIIDQQTGQTVGFLPIPYTRFPTTTQNRFNELDVFLSYKFTLGPIDVTVGNIAFFIDRRATTFETDVLPETFPSKRFGPIFNIHWNQTGTPFRTVGPDPTVEDEQFDRLYITLSTSKISKYITPSITYYQTIYSQGDQPTHDGTLFYPLVVNSRGVFLDSNPRPFNERNEADGGYLEGRINGHVPITKWADFNPYGIVSVSFRDRTEPGGANPYGGHPLTGWNHAQVGVEIPIHLAHLGGSSSAPWAPPDANLYLVPFGAYSYHISNPPPGTDRDEWWGGGKFEITF
jgi:hypothetical protein